MTKGPHSMTVRVWCGGWE